MPHLVLLGFVFASPVFSSKAAAQDFAVRVTQDGLDALKPAAMPHLPTLVPVDAMERHLLSCPLRDDIIAHVPPVNVGVGWNDVALTAEDGALVVEASIDLDLETTVDIDHAYACFGHATCDVSAGATELRLYVRLGAGSSAGQAIALEGVEVMLMLEPDELRIDSSGCAIGDAAEWLIETFRGWVVEKLIAKAEEILPGRIAAVLGTLLEQTVDLSIERSGFRVQGAIDSFDIRREQGITLGGSAMVRWTGEAVQDAPAPATQEPSGVALPVDFGPGQFQLAASDRIVTDALYEAWRGGLLGSALEGRIPPIELDSLGVTQQLGIPEGTRIEMAVDLAEPLDARFDRDGSGLASLGVRGLVVTLHVLPPWPAPASMVTVRVDGSLTAALAVDGELGGLVPRVGELDIERIAIESAGAELEIDRARIAEFVRAVATPVLAERFAGVPVAPSLAPIAGVFAHVRTAETAGGWERVGVDLITPDPNDRSPPSTSLVDPPSLVAAGTATFLADGEDGSTPEDLLRYRAWIDGVAVSESPSSVRAIRVDVADGEHVLRVAAVDLNGNEDATPVEHSFVADGLPPELVVTEQPESLVFDTLVTASWRVHDSGPTESRWELRRLDADGMGTIVASEPFAPSRSRLVAEDLEPGQLYELEIVARDQAGNIVSSAIGFGVDPGASSSGCAAAGSNDAAIFALLALVLVRRRRS
jgi:hypothetical protein